MIYYWLWLWLSILVYNKINKYIQKRKLIKNIENEMIKATIIKNELIETIKKLNNI